MTSILDGSAPIQEAVAATQQSIDTYGRLLALPGATARDLNFASSAWSVLGDELGVDSPDSMYDVTAALRAYRQAKALLDRALSLEPNDLARHGLIVSHLKMAEVDGLVDPYQELDDTQEGLREIAALPSLKRQSLPIMRLRMVLLEKQINALTQLARYSEARALADSVVNDLSAWASADKQDLRALIDLSEILDSLASVYETAANPALGASADVQRRNLTAAQPVLLREVALLKKILQASPSQQELRLTMADAQVRLGIVQYRLRKDSAAAGLVASGLAALRQICAGSPSSPTALLAAATHLLNAEPPAARAPDLALRYAERAAAVSHRKVPGMLLTLAMAYRANSQIDLSRATAREGLALLPQNSPHVAPSNLRRLLEGQAR